MQGRLFYYDSALELLLRKVVFWFTRQHPESLPIPREALDIQIHVRTQIRVRVNAVFKYDG
jgi:hypothetical protein